MKTIPWNRVPSLEELGQISYKKVDPSILEHAFEKRGFVNVPIDYSRPEGPRLEIFYRFMPSHGLSIEDTSRPVLVVVNGGPGMASHFYRPYEFDYTGKVSAKVDFLGELLKYFRVLIMDQRGTDGNSAPFDLDDPKLKPEIIARYFDSHHIARDQQEVIKAVIGEAPFFMIVQSYGGMVGMSYLTLPGIERIPKGICFSSAAMPHANFQKESLMRREKQKELNERLKETRPDLIPKILELKEHFISHGLAGTNFHYLWRYLGYGEEGDWQKKLEAEINELLAASRSELESFIAEEGEASFLNYVLSNPMFTPGYTDSTLAKEARKRIPYQEEWMLDEYLLTQSIGHDGTFREQIVKSMDASPHPGTPYASPEEIKRAFARTKVLISLAEGDIFLPLEGLRENASIFYVSGVTQEIVLPGGHKAIFLPKGAKAFHDWTHTLSSTSDPEPS